MPAKLKSGDRIVVASHNAGKVREIRDLLAPYGVETVAAEDLDLEEPEETGETFAENARIKARAAANVSGMPALADDSGLEVEALGGEPGIHSARWAGEEKDFEAAMGRVEVALSEADARDPDKRGANFTCVLALAFPGGECETFEGKVHGTLVWPPRGDNGFGYDPVFLPEGGEFTFGEMEPEDKHAISHRARAFDKFVASCFERN